MPTVTDERMILGQRYTDGTFTGTLEAYECNGTDNPYVVINVSPTGGWRGRRVIPYSRFYDAWHRADE
jgi:hypothetical protein